MGWQSSWLHQWDMGGDLSTMESTLSSELKVRSGKSWFWFGKWIHTWRTVPPCIPELHSSGVTLIFFYKNNSKTCIFLEPFLVIQFSSESYEINVVWKLIKCFSGSKMFNLPFAPFSISSSSPYSVKKKNVFIFRMENATSNQKIIFKSDNNNIFIYSMTDNPVQKYFKTIKDSCRNQIYLLNKISISPF